MNIELHGFLPKYAESIRQDTWSRIFANVPDEEVSNYCVNIVHSKPNDNNVRLAPFIRVFSDKKSDFKLAGKLLKPVRMPGAGMKTFVECVLLTDYYEL